MALNQEDQATNESEIAANESDQSTNNATVQSLAQEEAALDVEAAEIAGKGTSATLNVGEVKFKNGRVYLNDQLIGDQDQARLEDACRAAEPPLQEGADGRRVACFMAGPSFKAEP